VYEVTLEECRAKVLEKTELAGQCSDPKWRALFFQMAAEWQHLAISKEADSRQTGSAGDLGR
jgi:hypothetical protein